MLKGRKYQVIAVTTAVLAVVLVGVATIMDQNQSLPERYHQHEQAQQLADLPETDRAAASSTSIDSATFASHLPVVSIDTRDQEIPGDVVRDANDKVVLREDGRYQTTKAADGTDDVLVSIKVFDNEKEANRLSDEPALETKSLVHYRGHRSRDFPKRNYALHFVKNDGSANNLEVLGMPADNGWILNGPYLDKSLIRNYVAYNVFGELTENAPEVRFCELFVDGEYQGLFVFMESVGEGDNRIRLSEASKQGAATSYLLKLDRYDMEASTIENLGSYTGLEDSSLTIEYPNELELNPERIAYITNDFSAFEKALYSYDYDTADYGYWNYLDVNSFVNYFVVNEFCMNYDAGLYSTYLYKDLRGKITIGPIWDFNSAFDNFAEASYVEGSGFLMKDRPWFTMLVKDERFTDQVIKRYQEVRATTLAEERLLSFIDETVAYLGPAIERNWKVWGTTFDPASIDPAHRLIPLERNPTSYQEALDDMCDFIKRRGAWLDANIENLRQYSHESAVKMDNH